MFNVIKKLSNDYYEFSYSLEQNENGVFVGVVTIIRKDTGEVVPGGCAKYGCNRELIEKKIYDEICSRLPLFSIKPIDWNSNVRNILVKVLGDREATTNFAMLLDSYDKKYNIDGQLSEKFHYFCTDLISNTIWIIKEIEKLNADERISLLTSTEEIYSDTINPWNLDDISARSDVFRYFINPSKDEIDCHNEHLKRMAFDMSAEEIEDEV